MNFHESLKTFISLLCVLGAQLNSFFLIPSPKSNRSIKTTKVCIRILFFSFLKCSLGTNLGFKHFSWPLLFEERGDHVSLTSCAVHVTLLLLNTCRTFLTTLLRNINNITHGLYRMKPPPPPPLWFFFFFFFFFKIKKWGWTTPFFFFFS